MYFFTADEHYGHSKIIKYCNRPFSDVDEMDEFMITEHNRVVGHNDTTVHIGDFSLYSRSYRPVYEKYITRLKGNHIFIPGSHDQWMNGSKMEVHIAICVKYKNSHIWQKSIDNQQIVCCHYSMNVWPASHYNSWHLFGHSHGRLEGKGLSFDVGVDSHGFRPWSFEEVKEKMSQLS